VLPDNHGDMAMKRIPVLILSAAVVALGAAGMAQAPVSEVDAHVAAARAAAGLDFRNTFINLCLAGGGPPGGGTGGGGRPGGAGRGTPAVASGAGAANAPASAAAPGGPPTPGRGRAAGPAATPDRATWYAPPFKVFDNFYWLGTRQHSSWALQTSAGIIIIDTNFAWATEPEIIEGMTKLGLNPRDIKYVIISHAHGDHDQGAAELQKRYGAKVIMGKDDWETTVQRPATAAGGVPTRDISVGRDGYKLTLGDTTVDILATPGHTPGTLSYVFPVRNDGQRLMVAYSGGTLTGAFGSVAERWDEYIDSQQRAAKAAADAGATVILSNHSEYDGAYTKARLIASPRQVGETHPFIVGADGVQRYFTVMRECATASKLRNNAK
jgi:metallo-beta-lactamase class B